MSWDYVGAEAAHYRVLLKVGDKEYTFWTTAAETESRQIVFSNNMPGRPVDIFDNSGSSQGKFTWTVDAADESYNYSIQAADVFGEGLFTKSIAGAPAPQDLQLLHGGDQTNGVNTGKIGGLPSKQGLFRETFLSGQQTFQP